MQKLSVIMPNYNHGRYIERALTAILEQSRPPDEVIVIDDASTDDSREVIERLARAHPVMRPIFKEQNQRAIPNMNLALDIAIGDFVCFAGADDCVLPGFFEKSLAALEVYQHADMVCCDPVVFFDGRECELDHKPLPLGDTTRFITAKDLVHTMQRSRMFSIPGYTVLVRREAALQAGSFIEELRWTCDWFLLLTIAFRSGFVYLPEGLASFRMSSNSYHATGMHNWKEQRLCLLALVDLLNNPSYADVREAFVESGVMAVIGPSIRRLAQENKGAKELLKPWVERRILRYQVQAALSQYLPVQLKSAVKKIIR